MNNADQKKENGEDLKEQVIFLIFSMMLIFVISYHDENQLKVEIHNVVIIYYANNIKRQLR